MILYGYFRSSASWRVRIALHLKEQSYKQHSLHLRNGEQRRPDYLTINPQGLVPSLVLTNGTKLTQSLAIIEYLDEVFPDPPLLGSDPIQRAKVRAAAQIIACDTHPIQNLKILDRVRSIGDDNISFKWAQQTIREGINSFSAAISHGTGPFCFGGQLSLADLCLIPQLANARRFGADYAIGRIPDIENACMALKAFQDTRPEVQHDAE